MGRVAAWQEGSLASALTHSPTAGMAEVHQRVVSLGQVPPAEATEVPQGSCVRGSFSPGDF